MKNTDDVVFSVLLFVIGLTLFVSLVLLAFAAFREASGCF
jgi:hypothetical protein